MKKFLYVIGTIIGIFFLSSLVVSKVIVPSYLGSEGYCEAGASLSEISTEQESANRKHFWIKSHMTELRYGPFFSFPKSSQPPSEFLIRIKMIKGVKRYRLSYPEKFENSRMCWFGWGYLDEILKIKMAIEKDDSRDWGSIKKDIEDLLSSACNNRG